MLNILEPRATPVAGARPASVPLALVTLPWAAVGALLLGWWTAPHLLERFIFVPLLLSVVLFGLPHGALDHLVPGRLGWAWGRRPRWVVLYCVLYAALAGLYLLAWRFAPLPALWVFLLVSALHWGQGDLHFLEAGLGRRRPARWSAPLALLARGSLPILVPLLAFTGDFERLARGAALAFGGQVEVAALLPPDVRTLLTLGLAGLLALYALDTLRAASPGRRALELAEAALLLLLFLTVPAPLSIGVYFTLWHAWRHLGRLLALGTGQARHPSRRGAPRLAADLLPITLAALGMLGGLYLWAAPRVASVETFTALYLALIAALTLPHALVVALMDVPPRTRETAHAG
ncbi:Brp/Blh family beta-carotene 15,15'-dioxygenase [Deinococcus aestuarii]|uniref:Brp/Blh family beta-carotene 15,15'-dioxygenase n=1 Tax=Deinococcus aestuarii TaxID=2774531 RepID=UPI001C0B5346|nr:Brp/Blh family beta-carotene 15,15'-dioxygenase [Deinococcus aestuarii]